MRLTPNGTFLDQDDIDHIFRIAHALYARGDVKTWSEAKAKAAREYTSDAKAADSDHIVVNATCSCESGHQHKVTVARQADGSFRYDDRITG